jgi:hypothetical protein
MGQIFEIKDDGTIVRGGKIDSEENQEGIKPQHKLCFQREYQSFGNNGAKIDIIIDNLPFKAITGGSSIETFLQEGEHNIKLKYLSNFIHKTKEFNINIQGEMLINLRFNMMWGSLEYKIRKINIKSAQGTDVKQNTVCKI